MKRTTRGLLQIAAILILPALFGALMAIAARGQELSQQFRFQHPPATTVDPYADWKQWSGVGCCHAQHCNPTVASPDGRSLMRRNGEWWRIDGEEARQNVNRDQNYHICEISGRVVCFGMPDLGS